MFGFGAGELIVLAVVLILLFGSKKVPELARGISDAIKHIRNVFSSVEGKDTNDKSR